MKNEFHYLSFDLTLFILYITIVYIIDIITGFGQVFQKMKTNIKYARVYLSFFKISMTNANSIDMI